MEHRFLGECPPLRSRLLCSACTEAPVLFHPEHLQKRCFTKNRRQGGREIIVDQSESRESESTAAKGALVAQLRKGMHTSRQPTLDLVGLSAHRKTHLAPPPGPAPSPQTPPGSSPSLPPHILGTFPSSTAKILKQQNGKKNIQNTLKKEGRSKRSRLIPELVTPIRKEWDKCGLRRFCDTRLDMCATCCVLHSGTMLRLLRPSRLVCTPLCGVPI